jgi:hypothetical protein
MISTWLMLGLCNGCSSGGNTQKSETFAGRLGYEGCRLSKPLTMAEVMARDMSGGNEASRAHPDWDALIGKYVSGDKVYFVDCRRVDPTRIVAGISLYALVRDGVVIARVSETIHD